MAKPHPITPKVTFPTRIFVHREEPASDDAYWSADVTTDEVANGAPVAVYELREVKIMRVTRKLEGGSS